MSLFNFFRTTNVYFCSFAVCSLNLPLVKKCMYQGNIIVTHLIAYHYCVIYFSFKMTRKTPYLVSFVFMFATPLSLKVGLW